MACFRFFLLMICLAGIFTAKSQCPLTEFFVSETACINERILVDNISQEAVDYEWDFCSGELVNNPLAVPVLTNSLLFRTRSLRVIKQTDGWYGFTIDQASSPNRLIRFFFGTSLSNTPTVVDLGNPGGLLNGAYDFRMHMENGNWYALVANTGSNSLLRLSFGSDLNNMPSGQSMGSLGVLNTPNGIYLLSNGGSLFAFVTNGGSSAEIARIEFGNSIENAPSVSTFSVSGGAGLRGISITRECDRWFGLVTSYNNGKVFWLDFTGGIHQSPQTGEISFFTGFNFPASLSVVHDGGEYFAFVQSALGTQYRLNFGASIIDKSGTGVSLGNLGISNENFALEIVKSDTDWFLFTIDLTNRRLIRETFLSSCGASLLVSSDRHPGLIDYQTSGSKKISLAVKDIAGNVSVTTRNIVVSSDQAPDISFNSQNNCVNHAINFEAQNVSGDLVSYQWDFKDSNTSNQANPSHVFTSASEYLVQLEVLAANGCKNIYQNEVTVINQPLVDFAIPEVTPVCTNQPYAFTNLTIFDSRIPPIWEWRVNGTVVSSNQQLQYLFTNSSSQSIQLAALIPGCESILIKNIPVITEGPLVNFSSFGQCQDAPVTFTNETTGAVNGYNWDFGDGQNSIDEDPLNSYGSPGTFDVTLTAFGTSGCNNTKTESVTIYSKPQTNFSVALPPFSCSGTPTQFTDTTPNPFDSNLASWQWNFGDGSGSSTTRNPQYTFQNAGDYSVSLTATTNFGCSTTIQKPVTISPSPVANFTNSPPCLGVPINFTNTSTGSLQSQQWQIQSSFYTVANPVHAFLTSGDKNVTLNVTATNGCISSVSRTLHVPIVLTPDFSVSRNCINQQTEFTDITNDAADPVVGYNWNFAGLGNGTENPQVFSFANTGNFNVSLSVTTQTGCVHSAAKNVSIINSPQANFTATPSFGPPPLQVQFTNVSTNAINYLWQFNDPNSSSSTSVSPSFTFSELGSYEVDLTAFNAQGCSNLFSRLIEVVIPFTDVALTQFELIETGQTSVRPAVTIQNKGNIAITNLPLTFEVDGTAFRTFVATTIPPNSSYYHLSDFELPASSSLTYVCALAEIEDTSPDDNQLCASVDQSIVVLAPYPNPVTAQSHIDVQWIVRENRAVEVFMINSIGQTVYSERVNSVSGLNTFRLPATGFQTGLYFLQVRSGDFSRTHRLMIQE